MIHYSPTNPRRLPAPFDTTDRIREVPRTTMRRRPGVLVADDNPIVCSLLKATLELHGFVTWSATSGPETVGLYSIHESRIDVVLLDVRMPGDDGPKTLRALRRLNPNVRACFMTADPIFYDPRILVQMGGTHLFQKPFQLGHLVEKLRAVAEGTGEAAR